MVEVVQDLLDNVTYAGGVGRRRVDAIRGIGVGTPAPGFSHCAVASEDPRDPCGPRIVRMQELMFHELLDKPIEQKAYHLQLEEFVYRGDSLIAQVDSRLGEIQRMIGHDVLSRSRLLPYYLKNVNDELRRAQRHVCRELEDVWFMRFEPFFYPGEDVDDTEALDAEGDSSTFGCSRPGSAPGLPLYGGWLDIDDMFLTGRQLTRYVAELVHFIGAVIRAVPAGTIDATLGRPGGPSAELRGVIDELSSTLHGLGVQSQASVAAPATSSQPGSPSCAASTPKGITLLPVLERKELPLNQAILALDRVLTVHMKQLISDLHRKMYQTFFRICAAYARWKNAYTAECQAVRNEAAEKGKNRVSLLQKRASAAANASRASAVQQQADAAEDQPRESSRHLPALPSVQRASVTEAQLTNMRNTLGSLAFRSSGASSLADSMISATGSLLEPQLATFIEEANDEQESEMDHMD
eukprot:TRINITY_DN14781_c0_g1_i1.p1 TRINITY_DN14781_c0_g1~~TRINITY_DN14781_c0_g1_i1.p1  ORF type:complete len:468 (+),score=102.77 TRINITY_DN14781_c0_g1_i1:183-1586(+)